MRFLAAGYVTVVPTFRSRTKDPQNPNTLLDCIAIVRAVKQRREVDANSVVVYGCSGGGSLALRVAGECDVKAVVAEEPASVLFTGMFNKSSPKARAHYHPLDTMEMFRNPKRFYTDEIRKITKDRVRKVRCPVLLVRGDQLWAGVDISKINTEIVIPEFKSASKHIEELVYPGQQHCFGFMAKWDSTAAWKVFKDSEAFFRRYLPTKPKPVILADHKSR